MRRLFPFVLVCAAACSDSPQGPERDPDAPLQTQRLSYSLTAANGDGFYTTPEIRIALRNTTGEPAVLLTGLGSVVALALEQRVNGEWRTRLATSLPQGILRVERLQPGETFLFTTVIEGFLADACDDCQPVLDLEDGTYRFRIAEGYVDSFDDELEQPGEELPTEHRVSNAFLLDVS